MDADDLYGLALDRFVAERGALAKALRKEGRRHEAGEVTGLRKPSVAAWAVNQLARTQRAAMQNLLDAGDELRDAQADLLAGSGDGRTLRAAGDRERSAVDALVQTARGLLSAEGAELSSTVLERVSDTLHAAALDEDAREQVRAGRLVRELRHVGLGLGLGVDDPFAVAPRASPKTASKETRSNTPRAPAEGDAARQDEATTPAPPPKPSAADKRGARARAAAEREEAERVHRERLAARRDARAAHATARRRADAATRALHTAQEHRDKAARALRDAEAAVVAAAEQAEDADQALRRAETDLAHAEGER